MLNICRDGYILQNIISKRFGVATYANFKGSQFRTIRLSKVEPWILEGMAALEDKRSQKWKEETEIRAQRRPEGIMYDEVNTYIRSSFYHFLFQEKVVGGKIRFLYGSEYRKMYDPDGEFYQVFLNRLSNH